MCGATHVFTVMEGHARDEVVEVSEKRRYVGEDVRELIRCIPELARYARRIIIEEVGDSYPGKITIRWVRHGQNGEEPEIEETVLEYVESPMHRGEAPRQKFALVRASTGESFPGARMSVSVYMPRDAPVNQLVLEKSDTRVEVWGIANADKIDAMVDVAARLLGDVYTLFSSGRLIWKMWVVRLVRSLKVEYDFEATIDVEDVNDLGTVVDVVYGLARSAKKSMDEADAFQALLIALLSSALVGEYNMGEQVLVFPGNKPSYSSSVNINVDVFLRKGNEKPVVDVFARYFNAALEVEYPVRDVASRTHPYEVHVATGTALYMGSTVVEMSFSVQLVDTLSRATLGKVEKTEKIEVSRFVDASPDALAVSLLAYMARSLTDVADRDISANPETMGVTRFILETMKRRFMHRLAEIFTNVAHIS